MITEVVSVSINGQVQSDLVPDIVDVEVEDATSAASVFRVRLSIAPQGDGTWTYADDARLAVWSRVAIQAGYPDDNDAIIDGYITHVRYNLTETDDAFLEISGMDASAMMDLEEKQVAWANKKDSEIAQEIFTAHGLSYEVEDTVARNQEAVTTVLQSESDIRFLRRLAARNGFECYVKGSKGYFRSPNFQDPPQRVLAINFGAGTTLSSVNFEADGTPPTSLEIRRVDPVEKAEKKETLTDTPRRKIGARTLHDLRGSAGDGKGFLRQQIASSPEEMQGRLRAAANPASGFLAVSGDIDSRSYGAVLRAKRLVTIKGAGANLSGLYYITRVRHHFTIAGYEQSFDGYRNGMGLTGDEVFTAPSGLLPITPGVPSASVSTGNRVLPAQTTASTIPGGS